MVTKADAIMALAGDIAGRDLSGEYGTTIVDALDALADAMAGEDVEVSGLTTAETIELLRARFSTGGASGIPGGAQVVDPDDLIDFIYG